MEGAGEPRVKKIRRAGRGGELRHQPRTYRFTSLFGRWPGAYSEAPGWLFTSFECMRWPGANFFAPPGDVARWPGAHSDWPGPGAGVVCAIATAGRPSKAIASTQVIDFMTVLPSLIRVNEWNRIRFREPADSRRRSE